ncbi:MAG: TonB-dependent receptor [Sphingomonas sp.]|uniref:TonB-dependent receptor n=1 Tax=Sphingomonas sp. TaxID=28214 RepID=UPI001AFDF28E|nr:TonB-dependent receptor [Sphingomonas sp.]MBO9622943.1 TonB-dependent receptor [Sphingomonas sp.]
MTNQKGRAPLRASKALLYAGVAAIGALTAMPAQAQTAAELQAENQKLRSELEELRRRLGEQQTAPAPVAIASGPETPIATTVAAVAIVSPDPVGGDDIVVSARNRQELAQDVPLPVTVLGGETLERDDIKSIWDLPARVPNLQLNNPGENARKVSPSIRGLGRGSANDSMEQSVAVIVDGVTLYYSGQAWADYVDLDRIEVLNGPQGTLLGKNSSLGAINIVTRAPSFTPQQSFEIFAGDLSTLSGKFSAAGPLIGDTLAYRVNFVADRTNGIYTNTYQSMGHAKETWRETNRLAGRAQLLWKPSDALSVRVIADKLRSDERVNTGNTLISNGPATYADGTPRPLTPPIAYTPTGSYATYGYLGRFAQKSAWFHNSDGTVYQPPLNTTDIANSEARPQVTNQWGVQSTVDWQVAGHTLTSITAYRYQDFDIKNGGQFGQFYISNSGQQLWNRQFSQELRITSPGGKVFDYQAGIYYLNARVYSDDPSYYGQDAGAWYATAGQFNTLIANAAGRMLLQKSLDGVYNSRVTDARVQSLAAYAQADWRVLPKTTLTFGVRQTHEKKTNRVSHELDRPGENLSVLGATLGATTAQIAAAQAVRDGQIDPAFAWRDGDPIEADLTAYNVGLSYDLTDDVLLYSSFGKGVKSGFIFFATDETATESHIKPEQTYDIELGAKATLFDRLLQLNVNAYRTRIHNYQASWQRDDPRRPGSFISGWGNVERIGAKGVELQALFRPTRNWSIDFAGAYNLARYETQWLAQTPEIAATQFFDLKGEQVSGVPKLTLSYGFNYSLPLGSYLARVTFNNAYRSGYYLADNHAPFTYQDAYNVTNLGVGIGAEDRSWELSALVRNLFDAEYYTSASTWSNSAAQSVTWGMPRTLVFSFRSRL